jgi:hypothetical protein
MLYSLLGPLGGFPEAQVTQLPQHPPCQRLKYPILCNSSRRPLDDRQEFRQKDYGAEVDPGARGGRAPVDVVGVERLYSGIPVAFAEQTKYLLR